MRDLTRIALFPKFVLREASNVSCTNAGQNNKAIDDFGNDMGLYPVLFYSG